MTTRRDPSRRLVLIVAEGSTGSRAHACLDTQPLLAHLVDEFDLVVLDTDDRGEYLLRTHVGGGPTSLAGIESPLDPESTGDLVGSLVGWFADDPPALVHVQSGASSLYRLGDVFDGLNASVIVSIDGHREARSIRRRWDGSLERVDRWLVDSPTTLDHFTDGAPPTVVSRSTVVPPGSDLVPRFDRSEPMDAMAAPVRYAMVSGAAAHATLLRAERLRAVLPPEVVIDVFGAAVGASRPGVVCHGDLTVEELADAFSRSQVQIVEVPDGRTGTEIRHAALAAGAALLTHPEGTTAETVRLTGAGWVFDPLHIGGVADLLGSVAAHRDELHRALAAARSVKIVPTATTAALLSEAYRDTEPRR